MRDLINIVESFGNSHLDCWIKGSGELVPVLKSNKQYHSDVAAEFFPRRDPNATGNSDSLEQAYQAGWIRVYIIDRSMNLQFYQSTRSKPAIRVLWRMISQEPEFERGYSFDFERGKGSKMVDTKREALQIVGKLAS